MKKLLLLLSFSILYALPSWAQGTYVNGGITAVDTSATCSTTGGFVVINVSPNSSSVALNVSGTFSGTLQFVGTVDGARWDAVNAFPPNSTTAVTSTTSGGTWRADVANFAQFCVRASAFASGTATVGMRNGSGVSTSTLGSGGGGGGTVTSVSGTANQIDVATGTTTPVISLDPAFQFNTTAAGALTTAPFLFTGNPVTGGTGTTTVPLWYFNGGTAPTTWSTSGTYWGINAVSGFSGNFLDFHINGGGSLFSVNSSNGNVSTGGTVTAGSNIEASAILGANNKSQWNSASNGVWAAENFALNSFTRLAIGPDTTSFPALCPSGTTLQVTVASACTTPAPVTAASYQTNDSNGFGANIIHSFAPCETAEAPTTLATGTTTTQTGLSCLPAGSIIDAVVARVTTTITAACTGWELGDGTTAARFTSNNTGLSSGTVSDAAHIGTFITTGINSATTGVWQAAATKITITCAGGNPGAGAIRIGVFYHQATAPTS